MNSFNQTHPSEAGHNDSQENIREEKTDMFEEHQNEKEEKRTTAVKRGSLNKFRAISNRITQITIMKKRSRNIENIRGHESSELPETFAFSQKISDETLEEWYFDIFC
jgi:hypothetical protein